MELTVGEKLRILLAKRKMSISELARRSGQSRQNLSNKLTRNNFSEQELQRLCEALNCEFEITFTMKDTGDKL